MKNLPGKELVQVLEEMRQKLNKSGCERTIGIKDAFGDDCSYYKKSLHRFVTEDYSELLSLHERARELFSLIQGKS